MVKACDLSSHGASRASSNLAGVNIFFIFKIFLMLRSLTFFQRASLLNEQLNCITYLDPSADQDSCILVKDNFAVEGQPLTCASPLLKNLRSTYTASSVRLLQQAGFQVAGRCNMDEFAMGSHTMHSVYGRTLHPHLLGAFSAGGSSGGSAACVAAGLVSLYGLFLNCFRALGSDTGGSVRLPASYCGIVGFKPSYGCISRYGLVAYANSLDTVGILCDTVQTAKNAFRIMSKNVGDDMTFVGAKPFVGKIQGELKVGVIKEMMVGGQEANRKLLKVLRKFSNVMEFEMPLLHSSLDSYYTLALVEATSCLARYKHFFFEVDKSLTFGPEVTRRLGIGRRIKAEEYQTAVQKRMDIAMEFERIFKHVDVIVSTTAPSPPPELFDHEGERLADILTVPASLAGIPAISIPFDYSPTQWDSMVGIQLMGPKYNDERLLDIAQSIIF